MKSRVQELIQIGDQLFSKRFPLLTLWQTFAENFYPLRADMTRQRYISEEFASYLMTGRPVYAHRELSNQIGSILRPRGMDWFMPSTGMEEIDKDAASKRWLEMAGKAMRRVMYDRASQFTRATSEGDKDFTLFGQCVIEPRLNAARTAIVYTTWHLRDCVWAENADHVIDQFHRKWKVSARDLMKLYPKTVSPKVTDARKRDPFVEINCRVIVMPADEYDAMPAWSMNQGSDASGFGGSNPDFGATTPPSGPRFGPSGRKFPHPFIRIVIDQDNETILEETPQPELGYVIPRWVTIGGFSQYAYSPTAIVALPDARMLQQMTLTLLEVGQKSVDPPMVAVGDVINGGINLGAGQITWLDPDYDERTGEALRPMTIDRSGINWGTEYEDKIEKVLQEAFYLNVLNLPPLEAGDKMTATEVQMRTREYIQRATPLFEPMDLEYNGQLCEATWRIMDRLGAFGSFWDRPQPLQGQQIQFKFKNPLVEADGERKLTSFTKVGQLIGAAVEFTGDQTLVADFDADTALRDAWDGTGAPATWLRTKEEADQIKTQSRQQQQAAQAAQQLGNVAEAGGKAAVAVQNVGQAATSLQDAGLA